MTVYGSAYGQYQNASMNGMEIRLSGNNGANGMRSAWKVYGKKAGVKADERISEYSLITFRQVQIKWKDGKATVIYFLGGVLEANIPEELAAAKPWVAVIEKSGWRYQVSAKSEWVYL